MDNMIPMFAKDDKKYFILRKFSILDMNKCCLPEVLEYVSKHIGGEENELINTLSISTSIVDCHIKWNDMRNALQLLQRYDIIDYIMIRGRILSWFGKNSFKFLSSC